MNSNNTATHGSPMIWFGIMSAFLTVINNIVAIFALGVFQGPVVAFTTPFVFCLVKLRYPKLPGATLVYLPLIIVSIFTINFGPPGPYKIVFLIGAIFYDLTCYITRAGYEKTNKVSLWKLVIATIFYPIGLLLGALVAINWVSVEIPILSRAWAGVALMVLLFFVIGGFANWLCHRVYYSWVSN